MFAVATAGILIAMGMAIVRALLGPTVYDRVLAVNTFGTKTVLLIAVLGFLTRRPDFLDVAVVYALMNFIGVIALLRFLIETSRRLRSHRRWGGTERPPRAKRSPSRRRTWSSRVESLPRRVKLGQQRGCGARHRMVRVDPRA